MYEFDWTRQEIEETDADLVICHHENDMKTYQAYYNNYYAQPNRKVQFVHVPHCAKKEAFKDYRLPKKYDLLLCGRYHGKNRLKELHYPLRDRMFELLKKFPSKYVCEAYKHPGYDHPDSYTDRYLIEFAKAMNSAKICVTCSGVPKSRFGKYVEIPMCNSVICADLPDQDQEDFREFVLEINMEMTDEEIISKLVYYLENEEARNDLRDKGYQWSQTYGQEYYATHLKDALDSFLEAKK